RGQRIDKHMNAVIARKCGDAEIGDDEPLRGKLVVVVATRRFWRRRHDVDTRLQIPQRRINRECRGDVLIERGSGRKLTRPDFYAALVAKAGKLISVQRTLKI